jgi:hypothetical protein
VIHISPSPTADTRTCDYSKVTKQQLQLSSLMHCRDVYDGMHLFAVLIEKAGVHHDPDKLDALDQFHADFITGFEQTGWWDNHRKVNRHHLNSPDGVPDDVNLIDVLEFITDCVMAGMARSGSVYALHLPPAVLERAFQNTVDLLKSQVVVTSLPQEVEG